CTSAPTVAQDVGPAAANHMQALFVLGVVAVVVAFAIAVRERGAPARLDRGDRIGLALGLAGTARGAAWFYVSRQTFIERGHNLAASPMFLAIVAVVWFNARDVKEAVEENPGLQQVRGRYISGYRVIAVLMAVTLALAVAGHLLNWEY